MLQHKGTQLIETPQLILRRFTEADAQAMYDNWASDPEVTKYLTWPTHGSPEISGMLLKEWVAAYGKKEHYLWAIVLKENGSEPIGSLSADVQNEKVGSIHIGYCIGRKWWHRGIMSEALKATVEFLFEEVGAQRIDARHDVNNPNSGAVMRKCGMKYEGTLRRSDWNNQGICDACWYAILREER